MEPESRSWTLTYSDGAGNVLRFTGNDEGPPTVVYDPVKPAQSSSGVYSGGIPKQSTLDQDASAQLWLLVNKLEAATDEHLEHRQKGTGEITVAVSEHPRRSFVIRRGPTLDELDIFVARFRG